MRARKPLSVLKKSLFGLFAGTLASVLLLGIGEGILRLAGAGYDARYFVSVPGRPDIVTTNPKFGFRFFPPAITRVPVECQLARQKPDGTFRIFVLGGSAAMGTPDEAYGFGRILQVMLNEAIPDKQFEVVNAALTAVNSHVVLPIARECAEYDPDLFIVYAGNNEVVGPFGAGTVFGEFSPSLSAIRLGIAARSTRIGQMVDQAFRPSGLTGKWEGMQMFVRNRVAVSDPRLEDVYDHFGANLRDILELEVPVLLCTVGVNLADTPPFASLHGEELQTATLKQWEERYRAGVNAFEAGAFKEAQGRFEACSRLDDSFAELHYLLARCYAEQGSADSAAIAFAKARDLDALRFRADSRINAVIRKTAEEFASPRVSLVDCERAVQNASAHAIPGGSLFTDHVHYNFDGNYVIASSLFEAMRSLFPADLTASGAAAPTAEVCAERLLLTEWDRYRIADEMVTMMGEAPFTYQADHDERDSQRRARLSELGRRLTFESMSAARASYEAALDRTPDDLHFRFNLSRLLQEFDDLEAAAFHLRHLLDRLPNAVMWQGMLADVLAAQGLYGEAVDVYRQLLETMPSWSAYRISTGMALSRLGAYDEAIGEFDMVLGENEKLAQVQFERGVALEGAGQMEESARAYREVLKSSPSMIDAHRNLAGVLNRLGKTAEAMQHQGEAERLSALSQD